MCAQRLIDTNTAFPVCPYSICAYQVGLLNIKAYQRMEVPATPMKSCYLGGQSTTPKP